MKLIDLHCDTVLRLFRDPALALRQNALAVDLEKLNAADCLAQVFALFIDREKVSEPAKIAFAMLERLEEEVANNADSIAFAHNGNDIRANAAAGKKSAMIAIEEGAALEGGMENLHAFYDRGVRFITLTWDYPNEIGFPHCAEHGHKGLTPFGLELLGEMERIGVIPDVSHLSEGGFWDVAEACKKPFMATHSACRAIKDHTRNLDDAQIRALADNGGVMGMCTARNFLLNGENDEGRLDAMAAHIRHAENIGGIDVLAVGSDFDGTAPNHELSRIDDLNKLEPLLRIAGYNDAKLEKIYWRNALRVIDTTLL